MVAVYEVNETGLEQPIDQLHPGVTFNELSELMVQSHVFNQFDKRVQPVTRVISLIPIKIHVTKQQAF